MIDLEAVRERWLVQKPVYGALAKHVREVIEGELRSRGLLAVCTAREKDVASLLKKALRKSYDYDDIHDKAGVRVVVDFPSDAPVVEQLIRDRFSILHYENKTVGLDYDRLAYLGVHFEIALRGETLGTDEKRWSGLLCEIQVHTRAQNCWAEISHELIYKSDEDPPTEIKRRIYRLMALIELFDENVEMARDTLLQLPGFEEGRLLRELERWFYRLTARRFDRDLSLEILQVLKDAYSESERAGFGKMLDEFAGTNLSKLEMIYARYRDDERCSPLLFQPEALMVFERLTRDQFRLKEAWLARLPEVLLRDLGAIWGVAV